MRGLLIAAMTAAACARGGTDVSEHVLAKVKAARDRACACTDVACAESIDAKLTAWREDHQERLARVAGDEPELSARVAALGAEVRACTERLRASAPAPAAGTSTWMTSWSGAVTPPPIVDTAREPPPSQPPPQPGDIEPPPAEPTPAMRSAGSAQPTKI